MGAGMHLSIPSRLAVSTLLVLCLAVEPRAMAQPAEVRTITMRVAADEAYRTQPDWETTLRNTVRAVSDIYEKHFQIRFVVLDIVQFPIGPHASQNRMEKLVADVPIGEADILIGFSGGRCERGPRGWARPFDRFAVIMAACGATPLERSGPESVLSHELAHLFGAFHPAIDVESLMHSGPADLFDDQTTRVVRLMRSYDFRRGVMALDEATRRAWRAIYAEGHRRNNEANPLVFAIANAGTALARAGKLAEGEAALREAIKIDQLLAEPHAILGVMYARRGLLEEAVRELQLAKGLEVSHIGVRIDLGHLLFRLGRHREALAEFEMARSIDPRMASARVGLCSALVRNDRLDEAIRECTEAIQLAPEDAMAFNGRGLAHRRKGDFDRAIRDFDQAIRLQPQVAGWWNNRCFTRAIAGQLEAALVDCDESLRLDPQFGYALDSRGLAHLKLGRLDRAIADYDAALRIDRKHSHALYGRGLAKRKQGDDVGAEADLAAARTMSPRVAEDYAGYGIDP